MIRLLPEDRLAVYSHVVPAYRTLRQRSWTAS
jgi:hypothetical protein